MNYQIINVAPNSDEWYEARKSSIGASEVAAVLGLSRWSTPLEVYNAKMGVRHEIPANLERFGKALEPVIADWIMDEHPEVGELEAGFLCKREEYPWLSATPDRVANGVPVELKTSSAFMRSSWEKGVPDGYQLQVQTQILMLDASHGWLAVLHNGNDPELYRIERDNKTIDLIIRLTKQFWDDHVIPKVPPSPFTPAELSEAFEPSKKTVEGGLELLTAWYLDGKERSAIKEAENNSDAVADAFKELLVATGARSVSFEGKPLYQWTRNRSSKSFDEQSFKRQFPELYKQFQVDKPGSLVFKRLTVEEFENDPPVGWEPGVRVVDALSNIDGLGIWKLRYEN